MGKLLRVLIVEDSEDDALLLVRELRRGGYEPVVKRVETPGSMKEALENGEKVKISGFGNFEIRRKEPRKGRNPQTGEEIIISERRVLTFKPSQVLKEKLNETR